MLLCSKSSSKLTKRFIQNKTFFETKEKRMAIEQNSKTITV